MNEGFTTHIDDEAIWLVYNQNGWSLALSLEHGASQEEIRKGYHQLLDLYLEADGVL